MLGGRRASRIAMLLAAGLLAGCTAVEGVEPPAAGTMPAEPATAPPAESSPVGVVSAVDGAVTEMVFDPGTQNLAVVLTDPPRMVVGSVNALVQVPEQARPEPVRRWDLPLPGPVSDLTLAAAGGPLLVTIAEPAALLRVPLDDGTPSRTNLDGSPQGAATVGDHTVVALGDRLVILDNAGPPRVVPGFVDATRLVAHGDKVAILDQGRAAISLVDPVSGQAGPALRGGLGAANMAPDQYGRILVTDVRDDEFLIFGGDPLLLRQRYPLPGAPYALAYDERRGMAWVTLTARNEVVGLDVAGGEPVIVHRFPTVHQPDAVVVDPASGRVMVASASGAGLQVTDPERVES